MPRVKRPEGTGGVSFNMTPMIDIVFNLIIFFILTSQFYQLEIEQVELPSATTAMPKDYSEFRNVVINIKNPDSPEIIVFGRVFTPPELTEHLKMLKQSAGTQQMNVILRADANTPYEDVARVMLAAGAAEIEGWWITTEREDEPKVR